jgi:hypothetical protein
MDSLVTGKCRGWFPLEVRTSFTIRDLGLSRSGRYTLSERVAGYLASCVGDWRRIDEVTVASSVSDAARVASGSSPPVPVQPDETRIKQRTIALRRICMETPAGSPTVPSDACSIAGNPARTCGCPVRVDHSRQRVPLRTRRWSGGMGRSQGWSGSWSANSVSSRRRRSTGQTPPT